MAKKLYVRNAANNAWVEIGTSIPNIENYLTQSSASLIYATKEELDNVSVDLTGYLTESSASTTYATKAELQNIDLSSASTAAVTYLVDGAPGALDTLNELSAALNDDSNFATTVANSLANKLDISSASVTYKTIENLSLISSGTMSGFVKTFSNLGQYSKLKLFISGVITNGNTFSNYYSVTLNQDSEPNYFVWQNGIGVGTYGEVYFTFGNFNYHYVGYGDYASESYPMSMEIEIDNCNNPLSFTSIKSSHTSQSYGAYHGGPQIVNSESIYEVNSIITTFDFTGPQAGFQYRLYGYS